MEWGAEVPDQFTIDELVAAKEKAGVEVIGLCTPAGIYAYLKVTHTFSAAFKNLMICT